MLTHSTAKAANEMGAPSERWLVEQLRAGRFPGRKIGRSWRMTEGDIADAIDICRVNPGSAIASGLNQRAGLTPTSRKKVVGA